MFLTQLSQLEKAREKIIHEPEFAPSWNCQTGVWPDQTDPKAVVIKLFKRHWVPHADECYQAETTAGVFFSIWIDELAVKKRGLHYNLHALKLRQLPGYTFESRKFASAFRVTFGLRSADWPNVKMAFGPQTLFQGFAPCEPSSIAATAYKLAQSFFPLADSIDALFKVAAKRPELQPLA